MKATIPNPLEFIKDTSNTKIKITTALFVIMSIVIIYTSLTVGLTDNEAYYWSWSLKPALSYFDHPPLLAWTFWFTTAIFGKTNLAIRLPALISFWSTIYLFSKVLNLYEIPRRFALILLVGAPISYVFSWISLPDILFIPLSLLSIYSVLRKKFLHAGVALGLAILAKWHAILLVPGLIFIILSGKSLLFQKIKDLFKTMSLVLIFQAPVLIWNYNHDWASFRYHLINRHSNSVLTLSKLLERSTLFITGFLVISGAAFVYLAFMYFRNGKKTKFNRQDMGLLTLSLPMLLVFSISALKGESRIYWSIFSFFPLSIFFIKNCAFSEEKLIKLSTFSSIFSILAVFLSLYIPIGSYLRPIIEIFRSYDMRLSPRGDLEGWKEWVSSMTEQTEVDTKKTLFLSTDFRLTSQLLWNSTYEFNQVWPLDKIKQYSIWKRDHNKEFERIIIFGDNRRKIHKFKISDICSPNSQTKYYTKTLLKREIKTIEYIVCDI